MSTPRTPGIYIVMMSLITTGALAWSSIAAPSIEVGFFWASAASALAVSIFAWRRSDRIGQGGMLLVYVMLASSITLAVTSITDFTDFSFMGKQYDSESGALLGGILAFTVISIISVRLSKRYPAALAWGVLVACLLAWGMGYYHINRLLPDYKVIVTYICLVAGLTAFISLSKCKQNLTDSQYISVLATILAFVAMTLPGSSENLTASIIHSLITTVAGILFLTVRNDASMRVRLPALMLMYFGLTSLLPNFFQMVIISGSLSLIIGTAIIAWMKVRRESVPRGFYWVNLFTFGFLGIYSLVPEQESNRLFVGLLCTILFYVISCIGYAPSAYPQEEYTWRVRLSQCFAVFGVVLALAVTTAWFSTTIYMLTNDVGPSRMIALLKNTPLWPGDMAFVKLAMRDESLWPYEVRPLKSGDGAVDDYLQRIRPNRDRFSKAIASDKKQQLEKGFDSAGIGLRWYSDKDSIMLQRVDFRSPAGDARLARGDRIVSINNFRTKDIIKDDSWDRLFGDWKADTVVSLRVVTRTGENKKVSMTIGNSKQDRPMSWIIHTGGGNIVGYLYLERFSTFQFEDIAKYFTLFNEAGVRDLVLDLRYNHGGYIDKASELVDMIAGAKLDGKLFIRTEHSLRYKDRDEDFVFKSQPASLNVRRLVVLTTEETCSASEAVINGLRPHIPVYTVGSTTCGKPYIMQGIEFGDKTLLPVTARVLNSRGDGHYTKGIRPDFKAMDDLTHQLGDTQEGMLKKALEVLEKKSF